MRGVRECLKHVTEYKPGKTVKGAIKLSSNENPLGTSREVVSALSEMLRYEIDLSRYPWYEREDVLREEIAAYLHRFHHVRIPKENIVIGAGSDGILDTLTRIFMEVNTNAVIPIPTFSLYESLVLLSGGYPVFVSRIKGDNSFRISAESLISASDERTKMLFLCSPNNPTGDSVGKKDMMSIVEQFDGIIIIDEAYAEFAYHSFIDMPLKYENIVVTRTFSKAFALAGLRIGYAVLPDWLVSTFKKTSLPFSVNSVAIEAAIIALHDYEHLRMSIEHVRREREFLKAGLSELLNVYDSDANFLPVDVSPMKSAFVCDELLSRGIIVRDCSSFRGAGDTLIRISIGRREENERLISALKEIMA
ncbi:MAG: histidinol-phosphate transaminase [Canidatus Methanoxibalbensis ujae]|nr:histidinol-phosphate transaminase [Candidatus Methanoxibalbensis ujae]